MNSILIKATVGCLLWMIITLDHLHAGDAPPNVKMSWDFSSLDKNKLSISITNNDSVPIDVMNDIRVATVGGGSLANILKSYTGNPSQHNLLPFIFLVAQSGNRTTSYSDEPHGEDSSTKVTPKATTSIEYYMDDDFIKASKEVDEIWIVLVKDGKIVKATRMKKENDFWKEKDDISSGTAGVTSQ